MTRSSIIALRLRRQGLIDPVDEDDYTALYQDLQPGLNVYWNGFGDPPSLKHRAAFDDMDFNRERQRTRRLLKLRLIKGNLGWILAEDLEYFAALYRKPLGEPNFVQLELLDLLERGEPMTIQQIKEETGYLVKVITPVLHRLQEAFILYEDQYDGEWDRAWYLFNQKFPQADLNRYTRHDALTILLRRYLTRMVWIDLKMAQAHFGLPEKELKAALSGLVEKKEATVFEDGVVLTSDLPELMKEATCPPSIYAIHKNDILYRSMAPELSARWKREGVETIFYLLIDGEFHGAAYGKFRFGPPDFFDLVVDLPIEEAQARKESILEAAKALSMDTLPQRYNGKPL